MERRLHFCSLALLPLLLLLVVAVTGDKPGSAQNSSCTAKTDASRSIVMVAARNALFCIVLKVEI